MSEWRARRFWTEVRVTEAEGGYAIRLDARPVRTPAKKPLVVPSRALAQEIAAEWAAQEGEIAPAEMPLTRAANAVIDKVTHQHDEVAALIAAYGDSDLICYRAKAPAGLVRRQSAAWDPLIDWAARVLGARLRPVTGVMHAPQDPEALAVLSRRVHAMDIYRLTAFHDLVGLSGSLIIGFAAAHDVQPAAALWKLSRVDETWQQEQWGVDEEARRQAAAKESDFLNAKAFYDLAQSGE